MLIKARRRYAKCKSTNYVKIIFIKLVQNHENLVPIFSDNALANIQSPFKEYKQYLP